MIANLNKSELRTLTEYLSQVDIYLNRIIEQGEERLPCYVTVSPEVAGTLATIIYELRQIKHILTPILATAHAARNASMSKE